MKTLVTGRKTSGSWPIRGEQLGAAIGATVQVDASKVSGYDCVVIVKRPRLDLVQRVHQAKVPLIWDVVDSHPQPAGNEWDRDQCMAWLTAEVRAIRPAAIVAATQAMANDCAGFGVPVLALPHHARPGQALNPIRETVRTVGYEGGKQYIGGIAGCAEVIESTIDGVLSRRRPCWRDVLERECKARGWRFVLNPSSLAHVDIVVALREQTGYAPRKWKSGVKLANAQGSGTPIICNREAGYLETASGAEMFADYPGELAIALDSLTPARVRREASAKLLAAAPTLESISARYKAWLNGVVK